MFSRVFIVLVCIIFCSMIINMDAKIALSQGEYANGGANVCNKPDLNAVCVEHFEDGCTGRCETVWIRYSWDDTNKAKILLCRKNDAVQGCLYNNKGTVTKADWVDGNECA